MKEVRKNRSQEVKQETNKPSPLVGERIYGRTSETSPDCEQIEQAVAIATFAKLCERGVNSRQGRVRGNCGLPRPHFVRPRNDETTCHPELVSGSSYNEILKPLQEDPFCTKSVDFGKRRQVQNDMARSNQTAVWDDIEGRHCERSAAIQKKQAPTLTLPQKGGDKNSFPNEGRSEWVPINNVNSLTSCLPDIWTSKKKVAFTLAEVLITLGIIGVVAALTMPMLMAKYQAKVLRTQFLQANTIIGDALNHAKLDGADLNEIINNRDTESLYKYFKPGNCTLPSSFYSVGYYNYCGIRKVTSAAASVISNPYCMSNGMTLWLGKFNNYKPENSTDPWEDSGYTMIAMDINGWIKKPNKYGHDMFFWVYNNIQGTFRPLNSENLRAIGLNDYLAFASTYYNSCPGNCTGWSEAGIACTPNALSDPDYFKKLAL